MKQAWRMSVLVAVCALMATGLVWADNSAKGGTFGGPAPLADPEDLSEGFDDITTLIDWSSQNNSDIPNQPWFQGNDAVFPAHAGAATAYIAANWASTDGTLISNWLLTPELPLNNCGTLSFYTRTVTDNTYPDRLEVRYSQTGAGTNVGSAYADVGDFTNLIIQINPSLAAGGYPQTWTEYTYDYAMVQPANTGRIAFRYFVDSAGPTGANSNFIGVDTFTYTDGPGCGGTGGGGGTGGAANPVPTLSNTGLVVMMLALIAISVVLIRRRM